MFRILDIAGGSHVRMTSTVTYCFFWQFASSLCNTPRVLLSGDCRFHILHAHLGLDLITASYTSILLKMSSYDPPEAEDLITPAEFRESMRLVRLQIAVPISVLIALGANLVCALALKPGLGASPLPVVRLQMFFPVHH
jgi:hypothetical protein